MKLPNLASIRPTKTWIVLGVALGVGILAAIAARGYLANRLAEIDARSKGKTVNVVVAKRELRKGDRITPDTVAIRPIPVDYAHSQAIAPEHFDRVNGQPLAYPVKSGEMVLWGLLENKRTATFSVRVKPGHRAMTVPVDEINSISGLLEPGDAIDLMATIEQKDKTHIFPLLQNVMVMATGQRAENDPKSGEKRMYSTVTLDTSPEEAFNIIRVREAGKLTALLRNPDDKGPLDKTLGDPGDFFLTRKNGRSGGVPVLIGGRSGSIPADAQYLGRYQPQGLPPVSSPALPPSPVPDAPRPITVLSADTAASAPHLPAPQP